VLEKEQNQLVIKARPNTLCDGHLHKLGPDGMLRQCLTPIEASKVLESSMKDRLEVTMAITQQ
jgi:hypothetical protein